MAAAVATTHSASVEAKYANATHEPADESVTQGVLHATG
jgi:hypothetical protein